MGHGVVRVHPCIAVRAAVHVQCFPHQVPVGCPPLPHHPTRPRALRLRHLARGKRPIWIELIDWRGLQTPLRKSGQSLSSSKAPRRAHFGCGGTLMSSPTHHTPPPAHNPHPPPPRKSLHAAVVSYTAPSPLRASPLRNPHLRCAASRFVPATTPQHHSHHNHHSHRNTPTPQPRQPPPHAQPCLPGLVPVRARVRPTPP